MKLLGVNLYDHLYCYNHFGVLVNGKELHTPLVTTNDLSRYLADGSAVTYAKGYDPSVFGSEKYKNIYVFIIGTWLFFILALRSETVGSDLPTYINRYPIFGETPWKELPEVSKKMDMEMGYAILSKLLYLLSANPRVLICVVSFIIIYVFSKEIKDNSKNPAFSYFLYITLGMYVRAFTAYRQQIATALAIFSYRYIREKKPIKFLIVILIASTIHKSVLFVLPMYFIANMKINYKVYVSSFIGCILCITIGDRLLSYITYKDRYTEMVARGSDGAVGSCIIFSAFIVLMLINFQFDICSANNSQNVILL